MMPIGLLKILYRIGRNELPLQALPFQTIKDALNEDVSFWIESFGYISTRDLEDLMMAMTSIVEKYPTKNARTILKTLCVALEMRPSL